VPELPDLSVGATAAFPARGIHVEITVRPGVPLLVGLGEIARVLGDALAAGGAPIPATVGLVLSDDDELASLNGEQMGHEGATDVLSFPLLAPSDFPPHEGQDAAVREPVAPPFPLPPGQVLSLGDVVVSVERAVEQAEAGRGGQTGDVAWSPADELRLLVTHGALHLCGWDHERPEEAEAMRALERRLLAVHR
jgi:probable rRNA maturation factor